MKIRELNIIGFGKWQHKRIKLAASFQLFYGDNEAGKSTIYHFIRTMLFGFPHKRGQVKDYTPMNQGIYGGSLVMEHPLYGFVEIERIQTENRGKAKVIFADGQIGDESSLEQLLAPLTEELFTEVYSLQQEQLNDIKDLAEDQLQQLLLAIGVSGSQKLVAKQEQFFKTQQAIYKPTGRLPQLNQKLASYQELAQQISRKEQVEASYQRQVQELGLATKELVTAKESLNETSQHLKTLEKQRELLPLYEKRQHLFKQRSYLELGLTESALMTLEESYQNYQLLVEQEKHYQELKREQWLTSQASPAYLFFMEHHDQIKGLAQQQTAVETALAKQSWLTEAGQELASEQALLAAQLELSSTAEYILPSVTVKEELIELAEKERQTVAKLAQREQDFDRVLDRQEQGRQRTSTKRPVSIAVILALVAFISGGVLAFGLKMWLLAGLSTLVILVLGVVSLIFLKQPTKREELTSARKQSDALAEKIEKSQRQVKRLEKEKCDYSRLYGFSDKQLVSEWLSQWPLRERYEHIEQSRLDQQVKLQVVEEQLTSYRHDLEIIQEWVAVDSGNLSEQYAKVNDYVERMTTKRLKTKQTEQGIDQWQEPLNDTIYRKQQLTQLLLTTYPELGLESLADLPIVLAKQKEFEQLTREIARLDGQLGIYFELDKSYHLTEIVEATEVALANQKNLLARIEIKQKRVQELRFDLQQQERSGTLAQLYQEQAGLAEELRSLGNTWLDNRIAMVVLQDILDVLASQQLPALLATTTAFFKIITKNKYSKCFIEGEQLVVRDQAGTIYRLGQLSTGTRDQLYLAIRLAFIKLHSQEQLAPVIIDDGWLHYDAERKDALFELLTMISQDVQVICFTSDLTMKNYVEAQHFQYEVL